MAQGALRHRGLARLRSSAGQQILYADCRSDNQQIDERFNYLTNGNDEM